MNERERERERVESREQRERERTFMNTCIKILNIGINKNYIFMNFEIKNTNIDPYNYFS